MVVVIVRLELDDNSANDSDAERLTAGKAIVCPLSSTDSLCPVRGDPSLWLAFNSTNVRNVVENIAPRS